MQEVLYSLSWLHRQDNHWRSLGNHTLKDIISKGRKKKTTSTIMACWGQTLYKTSCSFPPFLSILGTPNPSTLTLDKIGRLWSQGKVWLLLRSPGLRGQGKKQNLLLFGVVWHTQDWSNKSSKRSGQANSLGSPPPLTRCRSKGSLSTGTNTEFSLRHSYSPRSLCNSSWGTLPSLIRKKQDSGSSR